MGGELKQILENQRQLEEQFEQMTTADQLREQAHSLSATAHGEGSNLLQDMLVSPKIKTIKHNYI